jgi:hypothetical protein
MSPTKAARPSIMPMMDSIDRNTLKKMRLYELEFRSENLKPVQLSLIFSNADWSRF